MQAFKAESSSLRQRLAAEQKEVGKRQTSQVHCLDLVYLTLSFAGVLTLLDCMWALSSC